MSTEPMQILRDDYRLHLQTFYTHLNLAPPYHSIEKAVQHLANTLRTKPESFLLAIIENPQQKWPLYEKIFEASGLSRKHRGIITQLALTLPLSQTKEESLNFLRIFTDTPSSSPC